MITNKASPQEIRRAYSMTGELYTAYGMGLIPKYELVHGQWYSGICRNADKAVWNSASQKFFYRHTKFGSIFWDEVEHPEDDRGHDLFFPTVAINEPQGEFNEQLRSPSAEYTA